MAKLFSMNVVDVPEDPSCRIEWISIPKKYFPQDHESNPPRMRCRFCHPELFEGDSYPLIPEFPDSMRDSVQKRYEMIMNSTRTQSIDVVIDSFDIESMIEDEGNLDEE